MECCRSLLVSAVIVGVLVEALLGNENAIGWGLPDAVAPVGKLFEFQLSKGPESGHEARTGGHTSDEADGSGDIKTDERRRAAAWRVFQVNENGRKFDLSEAPFRPRWLIFDSFKGKLYGVPDQGSLGHHYRLFVVHGGKTSLSDEFNIRVIDDSSSSWSEPFRAASSISSRGSSTVTSGHRTSSGYPVRCPYGLSITTATVVLDLDPAQLSATDRVRIIVDFGRHFDLPATIFRLRQPPHDRPLLDLNSALAAGPGDLGTGSSPKHGGLLVQWDVGCGNVRAELMPSLELLETSASDGRLGASVALHPPVIGWHIAKMTRGDVMGSASSRRSHSHGKHHAPRYVVPTATPSLPIAVMPTARSDVITVTVETPASTAVVPTTTASVVVIIPTATMTSPEATAHATATAEVTWTTSTEGFETTPTDNDVPTTDAMTSHTTEATVDSTVDWMETSTEAGTTLVDTTSVDTTSVTLSETVAILHPSVATFDTTTEQARVATTALPSVISSVSSTPSSVATTRTVTASKMTKRPTKATTVKPTNPPNSPPELRKPIGRLNVTAGKMLWFPISNDMFFDREDGGTNNLHLLFNNADGLEVTPMSWIKLNATSKVLFGLPMEMDVGRHQYFLWGVDKQNKMADDRFEVTVERGPSTDRISYEFSAVLNIDYQTFIYKGVERRLEVAARIAAAFGDPDPSRIMITDIQAGSVIYSWTNSTVPAGPPCPFDDIRKLAERIIDPVDGSTNPDFVAAMYPIPIKRTEFRPLGACANDDRLRVGGVPSGSFGGDVEVEPRRVSSSSIDVLLLVVVVSMVVVGVLLALLFILCIICCCRARRQSEKQRRQRDDELSCSNKGIPVIFADELDDYDDEADRKSSGTITLGRGGTGNDNCQNNQPTPDHTPASTLKRRVRVADQDEGESASNGGAVSGYDDDGRPAVPPPPEYPRSDPASRTSTLKSNYKSPLLLSEESDEDEVDDDGKSNRRYGNNDEGLAGDTNAATLPLYHPQPPNTGSLPPYRKL